MAGPFDPLDPNGLEGYLGPESFDPRAQMLQRQLAMAEALQSGGVQKRSTGLGAALGGAGDFLRQLGGHVQAARVRPELEQVMQQRAQQVGLGERFRIGLQQAREKREQAEGAAREARELREFEANSGFRDREIKARESEAAARRAEAAEARRYRQSLLDDRVATKEDERKQKESKELSEDLEKFSAPGFYQKYDEASEIIGRYPDDLPGVGPLDGRAPGFMVSDDGVSLRQSVGQMLAEFRKGLTGAGMSDSERAEYEKITGLVDSGNEKAYRSGVERLRAAMDARVSARAAGSPNATKDLSTRQPWLKGALDRAGGAQSTRPTPPRSGDERAALEWARANPSDPRAVKILQLVGGGP